MRRKFYITSIALLGLSACNIPKVPSVMGFPDSPINQEGYVNFLQKEYFHQKDDDGNFIQSNLLKNYNDNNKSTEKRKELRNRILLGRMTAYDIRFNEFRENLHRSGVRKNLYGNSLILTMDTLGTAISGGSSQVFSAISGALTNFKGVIDKDVFFEKTMAVLMQDMEAHRKQIKVRIATGLLKTISEYPLENGLSDLEDYYFAGTVPGALVHIANHSGKEMQKADQELDTIVRLNTPITEAFLSAEPMRKKHASAINKMNIAELNHLLIKVESTFAQEYNETFSNMYNGDKEKLENESNLRNFLISILNKTHTTTKRAQDFESLMP